MKNTYPQFAMKLFTYYLMEDASDLEVRLTMYLLSSFMDIKESQQYFLKDEFLFGHELFDDNGKRIKKYLGIGVSKSDLNLAIEEVNRRNLIQIKGRKSSTLLVKLNINYIKHASKEIYEKIV